MEHQRFRIHFLINQTAIGVLLLRMKWNKYTHFHLYVRCDNYNDNTRKVLHLCENLSTLFQLLLYQYIKSIFLNVAFSSYFILYAISPFCIFFPMFFTLCSPYLAWCISSIQNLHHLRTDLLCYPNQRLFTKQGSSRAITFVFKIKSNRIILFWLKIHSVSYLTQQRRIKS